MHLLQSLLAYLLEAEKPVALPLVIRSESLMPLELEFIYYARLMLFSEFTGRKSGNQTMTAISKTLESTGLPALVNVLDVIRVAIGGQDKDVARVLSAIPCFNPRRISSAFELAQESLVEFAIVPQKVPMRVLLPVLEGICLEESDYLRNRWESLLVASVMGVDIHPSYPQILQGMSEIDLDILCMMYHSIDSGVGYGRLEMAIALSITSADLQESLENLTRLGIVLCEPKALNRLKLTQLGMKFAKVLEGDYV